MLPVTGQGKIITSLQENRKSEIGKEKAVKLKSFQFLLPKPLKFNILLSPTRNCPRIFPDVTNKKLESIRVLNTEAKDPI